MQTEHLHQPPATVDAARSSRALWVAAGMLTLIGAFFLLREHWGHVAGYWPYALLLICPAMHLFHGHGQHGGHGDPTAHRQGAGRSPSQEG